MFCRRKRSLFTSNDRGNIQLAGNHVQGQGEKQPGTVQRYTGQLLSDARFVEIYSTNVYGLFYFE
jgi:hypothetical protein